MVWYADTQTGMGRRRRRRGRGNPPANANAKHKQSVDFGPCWGEGTEAAAVEEEEEEGESLQEERGGLTHIWYTKRDLGRSLFSSVRRISLGMCPFFMRLSCCFGPHAGICPVDRLRAPAQRPVRARIVTYVAGNSAAGVSGAGAPSFYAEEGRKEGCFLCCVRRRRGGGGGR